MDVIKIFGTCIAYFLIGFFVEILVNGEEYNEHFGILLFLWPTALALLILFAPLWVVYKLASWIRKIFIKE